MAIFILGRLGQSPHHCFFPRFCTRWCIKGQWRCVRLVFKQFGHFNWIILKKLKKEQKSTFFKIIQLKWPNCLKTRRTHLHWPFIHHLVQKRGKKQWWGLWPSHPKIQKITIFEFLFQIWKFLKLDNNKYCAFVLPSCWCAYLSCSIKTDGDSHQNVKNVGQDIYFNFA